MSTEADTNETTRPEGPERRPTREDVFAVWEAAFWPCECSLWVWMVSAEMTASWLTDNACRGCRARRILWELIRLSNEL